MPQRLPPAARWLIVMLLLLLLAGCASAPLQLPAPAPLIPPLPQEARQPDPPPICQPTCSAGLARLLDSLLQPPTPPASQGSPAKPAIAP